MALLPQACPFCNYKDTAIYEEQTAFSRFDKFPVTDLHALIIPRRHIGSFFELTKSEYEDCISMLRRTKSRLLELDESITSFNIGINDGSDAGQTIPHCHIHLIPRRRNDIESPIGGVRNIFPGKGNYQERS